MSFSNNISDKDIYKLLQQRMLEKEEESLLEAEAKCVYGSEPIIVPRAGKDKLILQIQKEESKKRRFNWLFVSVSAILIIIGLVYISHRTIKKTELKKQVDKQISIIDSSAFYAERLPANSMGQPESELHLEQTTPEQTQQLFKPDHYKGQVVKKILKENADCNSAIVVKDSVVISLQSPHGSGYDMEVKGNSPTDIYYFEEEHNTVWYRFYADADYELTFDIIPMNENDDYDFILFQYNGSDIQEKVKSKTIQPIRSCISRNDKHLQSKTGLTMNKNAPSYIHSGVGPSYVKSVTVTKGQLLYLLVDAVHIDKEEKDSIGDGHIVQFHCRKYAASDFFVGKRLAFNNIYFIADAPLYAPNSGYEETIDSIYSFLMRNPTIAIEIQGHVNYTEPAYYKNGRKTKSQILSEKRASKVFSSLLERGIERGRMVPVGYASTRRVIQSPKTVSESTKNVRVDIVISSVNYKSPLKSTVTTRRGKKISFAKTQ
jgi:outer membrane protein OmpA-like peptidoglycan-associated protein